MNRKLLLPDMAAMLSESSGISKHKAENFIRAFFNTIETGLQEDKLVKIKGFGTFKIVSVSSRESVNVNTGERITLEEHSKITFTPDSVLKELVNRPFSQFQTVILDDDVTDNVLDEAEQRIEQELSTMMPEEETPQKAEEEVAPAKEEPVERQESTPAEKETAPVEVATVAEEVESAPMPLMTKPEEPKHEKSQAEEPQTNETKEESTTTVPPAETPSTQEHTEEASRSIWKPVILILAGLLLFALGYLCGARDVFGVSSDGNNVSVEDASAASMQPDSIAKDSLPADSLSQPEPITTLPMHPEGEIRVNGQLGTHVVGRGESIVQIAVKYYGSKDYAPQIINFNELSNPDILNVGQEIKLPRLEVSE